MSDAMEQLQSAAQAVSTAVLILRMELPTIEAFLKESRNMDNFGHIVDPTLFKKSERRAANAVVEPLFKAAAAFVAAYDTHVTKAREALEQVKAAQ